MLDDVENENLGFFEPRVNFGFPQKISFQKFGEIKCFILGLLMISWHHENIDFLFCND